MPKIETYVAFDDNDIEVSTVGGLQPVSVLGAEYETALLLRDLLGAVKEAMADAVDVKSEVTIEVSGTLELKGTADTKFLVFNIGGSSTKSNTMKVSLTTELVPAVGY